jgi:allantoicase
VADDGLIDLAAARLGGLVLDASDEYFAPKESLLDPRPPVFDPAAYGDRGKVMDGWESRRRRDDGHDWCVVRLGVPGVVREAVVETTHFRGNHPEACALEGCVVEGDAIDDATVWAPLAPRTPLDGDAVNRLAVGAPWAVTHVRLSIFPDGGVARLRLYGEQVVDVRDESGTFDVAAAVNGGAVVSSSDAFFGSARNLIAPGDSTHMGDGWETRRRRGPGADWAVVALAAPARLERVELDTTHFKGNYPDRCLVEACDVADAEPPGDTEWRPLVDETPMRPHARHTFRLDDDHPVTHLRLTMRPDGGVARMRAFGRLTDEGRLQAGLRWLNTLLPSEAGEALRSCCAATAWTDPMVAARPFAHFEALTAAADDVWSRLGPDDWREAFAAHPRIGERSGGDWSREEQSGVAAASSETRTRLEAANRVYEERFGHVFLICATGKSADEMLAALERRLDNDPDTELAVAAEQHRKITRLRLAKLLCPPRKER